MVKSFDKLQAEADQLIRVWNANPIFSLGDVSLDTFQTLVNAFKDSRSDTQDLKTQLMTSVDETHGKAEQVAQVIMRARAGIRAYFGADSTQYEQIGGVRTSQRKRKAKAVTQTAVA